MTGPRTYDPVVGRFLQGDPLASRRGGWTPFHYSSGNPVRRKDGNGYQDHVVPALIVLLAEPNAQEMYGRSAVELDAQELGCVLLKTLVVDPASAISTPANAPGPDTIPEYPSGLEGPLTVLAFAPAARGFLRLAGGFGRGMAVSFGLRAPSASTRVTQFFDPLRGGFSPGSDHALMARAPRSRLGRAIEGPGDATWVVPGRARDITPGQRLFSGRPQYDDFVEFSVRPGELANPRGVKSFYAEAQQILPGQVAFAGRSPAWGTLPSVMERPLLSAAYQYGLLQAGTQATSEPPPQVPQNEVEP